MYSLLIIDDEPLIIDGLKNILPWEEYDISICGEACNGDQGIQRIRELKPDLVITDIRMPKISGLELITEIQNDLNPPHFIILSGYDDFAYVKTGITLGVENYLLKPVNEKELAATISLTIEKIEKKRINRLIQQNGISVLNDNILYRWAAGLISTSELEERTGLLNIPMDNKFYSCGLFHCTDPQKRLSVYGKVQKSLSDISDSGKETFLWTDVSEHHRKGDLILLFSSSSGNYIEMRKMIVEQMLSSLTAEERDSSFVTLGKVENSCTLMKSSFENAVYLQKYSLVLPEKKILQAEEATQIDDKSSKIKKTDLSRLFLYIRNSDKNRLDTLINKFFQSLREIKNPNEVQNEVLSLLFEIDHFCEQVKLNESILLYNRQNIMQSVLSADTMENLQRIIMETLNRLISIFENNNSNQNPIIRKVLTYINENLQGDISLKHMGYEFNINSNYLGQIFRKETGESYTNYVNDIRVQTARKMLEESLKPAADIAAAVGFLDPNYFYRVFREKMNCTPTEYRKQFIEIN